MSTEPTSPSNTARQDPLLTFAEALLNPDTFITDQESQGQVELVNSTSLPTEMGDRTAYEAVGFVFGDPIPGDELFTAATLPAGWKKESTDHALWSSVVDQLGRKRVLVFYKAAFYDRKAHMSLSTVYSYANDCLENGRTPVLDDAWSTRETYTEALDAIAEQHDERAAEWLRLKPESDYVEDYRNRAQAARAAILALGEAIS